MGHAPTLDLKHGHKEIPPEFDPLGDTVRRILPREFGDQRQQ